MCSTPDSRLARVGDAIEALAERARNGGCSDAELAELAGRLARVWAMVADLDPAVAASLARYSPGAE